MSIKIEIRDYDGVYITHRTFKDGDADALGKSLTNVFAAMRGNLAGFTQENGSEYVLEAADGDTLVVKAPKGVSEKDAIDLVNLSLP